MESPKPKSRDVRRARAVVQLDEGLTRRLASYALAATAAGVGALGMPRRADASIIYTPVNMPIVPDQSVEFSLTNDSQNIFSIRNGGFFRYLSSTGRRWTSMGVLSVGRGSVMASFLGALKLYPGAVIGPSGRFSQGARMGSFTSSSCFGFDGAPWHCGADAYLGVRFKIDGQVHYGWVSLWAGALREGPPGPIGYSGEITGYAYQTNADQSIVAGRTPEPGTLELLALGSLGLALWRRKKGASR